MRAGATPPRGAPAVPPQTGKPRLLVVTPDFPPAHGGVQVLLGGLVENLRGFDMQVIAVASPGAREFDEGLGVPVRRVGASSALGAARHVTLNAAVLSEARRFDPAVCLAGHIVSSPATALLARRRGLPTAQYFHANEIVHKPRLAAFAARTAAVSIVVSSYTAGLLAGVEPRAGDVRLIPPGIPLGEAPSTSALAASPSGAGPAPGRPPTFVTVSRLVGAYKGHDVLLRALGAVRAEVPDVRWVVIGDGPLRPTLEAQARAAGLGDAVHFLGSVPDEVRDAWLRDADVFAMPSRLPGGRLAGEGFGIVYLEAAARGTPSLAGRAGGAVDAVVDGETGVLVDPTDAHEVAEALVRLLGDRDLARRFGAAAAARAREYAWPAIAGRVEEVLLELVERAAR